MAIEAHVLSLPTDWWMVGVASVQALGSIVAIGAAIWISRGESRRIAAEKRGERIDHISLVQGVANMAYFHIEHIAQMIRSDDEALNQGRFDVGAGAQLSGLLLKFDPQKLRSPPGAIGVISLANACASSADWAERAGRLLHDGGSPSHAFEDDMDEWTAAALAARNDIMQMNAEF